MRVLILVAAASLLVSSAASVRAATYVVDPAGGGDYTSIPEAMWYVDWPDTVELVPWTYDVSGMSPGWPIELDSTSPHVVGRDGAESTVLRGNGVTIAFMIPHEVFNARMDFEGITFLDLGELFGRGGPYGGEGGGSMRLVDCVVQNCGSDEAVDAQWCLPESGLISECRIVDNPGRGIFTYHYFGTIQDCEIARNGGSGISGLCCEEPTIVGCHIHDNQGSGIVPIWMYTAEYNIIEGNEVGIYVTQGSYGLRHNIIRGNTVGVEYGGYGAFTENDIYANEEHNVRFIEWAGGTADFTMNWWGTTDADEIAAGIWDCYDDPAIAGCVLFDPWCWSPGCTGTPVQPTTWGGIKALYR